MPTGYNDIHNLVAFGAHCTGYQIIAKINKYLGSGVFPYILTPHIG